MMIILNFGFDKADVEMTRIGIMPVIFVRPHSYCLKLLKMCTFIHVVIVVTNQLALVL